MPKRCILMLGWEFPPNNSGGLGVACQGIVENLVDQGEDVVLVLPDVSLKNGSTKYFLTPSGKRYRVIFVSSNIRPYVGKDGAKYNGSLIDDVEEYARLVMEAVKDIGFDLIHIHDWLTVPAGEKLKEKFGKPLVMHVHSTEFDRTGGGVPNYDVGSIERSGFMSADMIITVSHYTKNLLVEKFGVSEEKIRVVHNGSNYFPSKSSVSVEFLKGSPVVLFVGRLTIQKGPEQFLELARKVIDKQPRTVFVIAGNGDMYQHLLLTSAFQHLTGHVLFAGFLRDIAKDRLYHRADVFVMPSISEPFGIVALEAAAAGVPVIVSKTSGVAEVLPSAIKLDFWDTDKMAESVLKLIDKKYGANDLGEKIKEEAAAVTWDKSAMKIRDNYQQLLLPS